MNDDDFWGGTNPGNMSIDTKNSKEMMTGSHITELNTHKYKESIPPELLNKVLNVSQVCDSAQKCQLDPLDKSKDSNMLSNTVKTYKYSCRCYRCQFDYSDYSSPIKRTSNKAAVTHDWAVNLHSFYTASDRTVDGW